MHESFEEEEYKKEETSGKGWRIVYVQVQDATHVLLIQPLWVSAPWIGVFELLLLLQGLRQ